MRRFLIGFAIAVSALFALPAHAQDPQIEAFIDREMPASWAPGMAYAVLQDGAVITGARGEMRKDSGRLATAQTPFAIGSVSKSFTALAIMQLVEAGQAELDAPVARYLPAFADGPGAAMTLRQLLSHTSGYSTLQGNGRHVDESADLSGLSRQVDMIAQWQPEYPVGAVWEYSNANYQVLGAVIEAISGQDYASYIEANILTPLGMTDSFVADGEVHEEMAIGHRPWFFTKRAFGIGQTHRITAPQGGVVASAADMAIYLAMMMNGEDDIVSAASKAAMMQPASEVSPYYGLGWFLDPENGTVFHSGLTPGSEALASMIPAQQRAAVVLINGSGGIGFGDITRLKDGVVETGLRRDYPEEGAMHLQQKALFLSLVLLPAIYLLCIIWAWRKRAELRAKSGAFGQFSLWFPLLMVTGAAWFMLYLIPRLFAISPGTMQLFLPDFWLAMVASSVMGIVWAVTRLAIALTGRGKAR